MGGFIGSKSNELDKEETQNEVREQIVIVEHDNLKVDDLKIDNHYEVTFSSALKEINYLTKYEINSEEYKQLEETRMNEDKNYIITRDFIENNSKRSLFVKVIDFTFLRLYNMSNNLSDDLQVEIFIKIKKCKRLIKELIIRNEYKFRFLDAPIGYFQEKTKVFIMFENINFTLKELFVTNKLGPFLNRLRIFKNLVETIIELHSKGIVCLEISVDDIGFNKDFKQLKLLSLGNSMALKDINNDILVENWFNRPTFSFFTAPEIYLNLKQITKYLWSLDIWSLGVLTYCIFRRNESIFIKDLDQLFKDNERMLYTDKFNFDHFLKLMDFSQIENVFVRGMISTMLKINGNERCNIFQIADSYNKIIRLYELEKDGYLINYEKNDILSFLKVFDNFTYDLLIQG